MKTFALVIIAVAALHAVCATVFLRPVSNIYIPYDYEDGSAKYGIDKGACEQTAYDMEDRLAYTAGNNHIHIVDFGNAARPSVLHIESIENIANDIEMCGDHVAVASEGSSPIEIGKVIIYRKYNRMMRAFNKLWEIEVGYKPDMLKFTSDCSTLVVANEGEAAATSNGNTFVNPEGSLSVIRFTGKVLNPFVISTADFSAFDAFGWQYEMAGVRWPYKGELGDGTGSFSQNLEPEYITFNYDDTIAYISLQENNAIAVLDLTTEMITALVPLGTKSWSDLLIDASDKDGGIHFKSFDIESFRQPDSIKYMDINGQGYIITANEGDKFKYSYNDGSWEDYDRGEDIRDDGRLSSTVPSDLEKQMNDDNDLGRLQFSLVDGIDSSGKIAKPTFFGSRGFSIFTADNFELVYDSGDDIERKMAIYYPQVFNGNTKPDDAMDETPQDLQDSRSDNHGPECESLELGEVNGKKVLFVGIDRSAAIAIYSFTGTSPVPTFESMYRAGGTGETFDDLLDDRNLGDLDPEDLKFIPASFTPNGRPMLLVTSTVSGTLSLYEVDEYASVADDFNNL